MKYPMEKYTFHIAKKTHGEPYQVVAVSTYAGKTIRGVAKCDPRDEFSIESGKKLAAARCALKAAEKRAKRAARKYEEAVKEADAKFQHAQKMQDYLISSNHELLEAQEEIKNLLSEY